MSCQKLRTAKIILVCIVIVCKGEFDGNENLDFEKYPNYGIDWVYFPDGYENLQVVFLTSNNPENHNNSFRDGCFDRRDRQSNVESVSKDVTFMLYTLKNTETGELVFPTKKSISKSNFSPNRPSKFLIHGWMSSGKSDTCQGIKNEYLKSYDYNVFVVDWSPIAENPYYVVPMSNTKNVGQDCAYFLDILIKSGARTKDIHLIGHSLGAHIAGFTGEAVKTGTISRITGLDPALPGFNIGILVGMLTGGKLSKNAANFVDVIHTCSGALGLTENLGHADFFPNGGSFSQPGCGITAVVLQACSHGRSWHFFKESINGQYPFIAKSCSSYNDFLSDNCSGDITVMGEGANHTANGNYYLKTAPRSPFARLST